MSYRFVRITSNYPQYINSFYLRHPEAHLGSYAEQHVQLTQDSIETASIYVKNLNKIGVEAHELISNATVLQEAWKKENNLPANLSNKDLIINQIKHYQPEVVWVDDFTIVDKAWKAKLLKEVPSVKLFVGHHCAPSNEQLIEKLKLFDIMFTCIPCLKKDFEALGIKSYLLYHGFESPILDSVKINNKQPESEFLFAGSLYSGAGFHQDRIDQIEAMLKAGIKMNLYCNLEPFKKIFVKKTFYHLISTLNKLRLKGIIQAIPFLRSNKAFGEKRINFYSKNLKESSKAPVFGFEMYQLLSNSKICFNKHIEAAGECAGNIRLFEATGLGTCLVTDWKDNITQLFEPGKEIVTYKTEEECIEKVKWLIENPEERKRIAKAGQERTLKDHTFEKRIKVLNEIILKELNTI